MRCLSDKLMHAFFNLSTEEPHDEHEALVAHRKSWTHQQSLQRPFRIIISLFLLISNSLIIIGIRKTNSTLSMPRRLFIYSSCVGICTSAISPVNSCIGLLTKHCLNESITDSILIFLLTFDFSILLVIGIVRYMCLSVPLKKPNPRFIYTMLVIGLGISLATGVTFFYLYHGTFSSFYYRIHWLSLGIFLSLCMLCCILLMAVLWYTLRYKVQSFPENRAHLNRNRKAVKRLLLLNFLYVCFNVPMCNMCFSLGSLSNYPTQAELSRKLLTFSAFYSICIAYSGFNSLVYIVWDDKILAFFKKQITSCCTKCLTRHSAQTSEEG